MPSSPSRPAAAAEVSDAEMSGGGVLPRQAAEALVRGAANRAAAGSAGEEDEEIYDDDDDDDDESSDYDNSYDDSDESGWYYEDHEEEDGAGGDRASGGAEEEEAASAGVGGCAEAEGSPRAAATCCICMDPWTSYGAHRICCIPCGHVYGRSCLERWLRRGGNTSAKCPQCSARFKHGHIINLYSPVHLWNDCCLREAYIDLVEAHRQELIQHGQRVQANEDYNRRMLTRMFAAMRNGTVPTQEPPPPPAGPPLVLPLFDEFVALRSWTPGTGGSSVGGGGPGGSTPESWSPSNPVWQGGGGLGGGADASGGGAADARGGDGT